jgi:hypothetical protein
MIIAEARAHVAAQLSAKAGRILESNHRKFYEMLSAEVAAGKRDDRADVRELLAK